MKVGVYARHITNLPATEIKDLFRYLHDYAISVYVHADMYAHLCAVLNTHSMVGTFAMHDELPSDMAIMLSLGGDGTFLDIASLIREKPIPIIGINFGRLGFLADANKQDLSEIIKAIHDGNYFIDQRVLLHIDHEPATPAIFADQSIALNDCVIKSTAQGSMLHIKAFLNGEFLTSYWSDGVIVSTPTGSTGYALSCGGAIIFPDAPCFSITPIAAHHLNVRPIIVSNTAIIAFEVNVREEVFSCHLDTRRYEFSNRTRIAIRKAHYAVHVVKLHERSFLDTLKQKLLWGEDPRNMSRHSNFE